MSTELMKAKHNGDELTLTRVSIGNGRVGYQINVCLNLEDAHECPVDGLAWITVDAETIRNMARHVEASEKEMASSHCQEIAEIRTMASDLLWRIDELESQVRG